jgi:phytoene dehydrogenase-like protein
MPHLDAIVVGSGPNGLAAALTLARAGRRVVVYEAAEQIGGGLRSAALTLPGFVHDVCAAVHPLAASSPCFRTLPLRELGVVWVHPPAPLAHLLDEARAVLLERDLAATARALGRDARAYARLFAPLAARWEALAAALLRPIGLPRHPTLVARFAWWGLRSATTLARRVFAGAEARALFAGLAAHSMLPLDRPLTSAVALLLGAAGHGCGWPIVAGGSQRLAEALATALRSLGGELHTSVPVRSLDDLPPSRLVLCDLTPRQLLALAGDRLPPGYRRRLARYRYGVGAFKIDWALDGPIPWQAAACRRAGTVHLGGALEEVAAAEAAPWQGTPAERPFVLLAQPSLFDPTRAPAGRHTAWAYCHVPHGWKGELTDRLEARIEQYAPGFRARILARHVMGPAELEQHNPNLVGGDINGGVQDLRQTLARPTWRAYRTPVPGLYLCSSSTPPGGGAHGMCGYFAAQAALRDGY